MPRARVLGWCAILAGLMLAGCQHRARPRAPVSVPAELTAPALMPELQVMAVPPIGWRAKPTEIIDGHVHQTWVSPSGETAYGVICARMPLPVGPDLALIGFLRNMRKREGDGTLWAKQDDPALPGIRFKAEGGRYLMRASLITRNWTAWVIYAGTLRGHPELPEELRLAEQAREATVIAPR